MQILLNKDINRTQWAEFVLSHPKGNVFQTPDMYDVYALSKHIRPIVVAATVDNQIIGILLAQYITNGNAWASWLTARSIITGGPLARDNDSEIIHALFDAYKKQLPIQTIYSEIRPIYEMQEMDVEASQEPCWKRRGHYNLVLGLDRTTDELFENMHKERRRNVNQAIKAGLAFREVSDINDIHSVVELIKRTYERKHVPISYLDMFDEVRRLMSEYAHFFACYTQEGTMIAGEVRLWHDMGYKWFDFGGGGEPGVEYGVRDYKLKYGCEMYDYGRYTLAHRPITLWAGTMAYKLYHKIKGK